MRSAPPRVFLSHSSKDKPFVEKLYHRLTRDGVSCFFDQESIGWGDNWVEALERALDECEHIVFVLSPDFCNSEWVKVERTSSMANDPSGLERKVRPLMLKPCRDLPNFPRFLRNIQAIDISTEQLFEKHYERICVELGGQPRPRVDETTSRDRLPDVHPLPERYRMPFSSMREGFIGRVEEFWRLHESLTKGRMAVLQGVSVVAGAGGLGKTQLAIEYAHRLGHEYSGGVYWVQADLGIVAVVAQVSEAARIEIDPKAEERKRTEQLWQEMNRRGKPYLLILDNFPEDVELRPYLPATGAVHTIVTTRRQDLTQGIVLLATLSPEESIQLLNSGGRPFGDGAAEVAERLGGLPLALELCRSYWDYRRDLSVTQLIEEMNAAGEMRALAEFASKYHDQLPSGHQTDVAGTFELSWMIAPEQAKQVLRVMGELAPAPVPRKILRGTLQWPEQGGLSDPLGRSLAELSRLSLIEIAADGNPSAHRLILDFVRHRTQMDGASPLMKCVQVIIDGMVSPSGAPDAKLLQASDLLLPHAEALARSSPVATEKSMDLLGRIGTQHRRMGRFVAARHAFRRALSGCVGVSGLEQWVSASQSNLALVLQDLGELEEARDLLRKALAAGEQTYAAGHPSIAISQGNLALVLKGLGELEEARDLLRQAVAAGEQTYAAGHPSIATSQSNLALVLKDLGELEEARDLLRQALAADEQTYAAGHPSIAISQGNLALVLKDLGELDNARELLRKALAAGEQTYAAGHPSTATRQSNLALVLKDLGELEEARKLAERAYRSLLRCFGAEHRHTKTAERILEAILRQIEATK